jgi:hypothetical protein
MFWVGIEPTIPSVLASEDSSCLRPRGYCDRLIDHLQISTTNNCYTIADLHTPNHTTLNLLNLFSPVFTALHNGYSSTVSSLDVLWQRILTSAIRWLTLHSWSFNCNALIRSPFSFWFDCVLYYLCSLGADLQKTLAYIASPIVWRHRARISCGRGRIRCRGCSVHIVTWLLNELQWTAFSFPCNVCSNPSWLQ